MNGQRSVRAATYPRAFLTPEGRAVSIKKMGIALKTIRKNPGADYPGWNWFLTQGYDILREFQRGLDERINARAKIISERIS